MLKIGLGVMLFRTLDINYNIEVIRNATIYAKNKEIDFLCFGEAVLQGFHSLNGNYERDIQIALNKDGEEIKILKGIAKENKVAIAFGYIEEYDSDIYSSYLVIDKFGLEVCNFRRVSIGWKERNWNSKYKEGVKFGNFSILGASFTVGLCGDFWMDDAKLPKYSENVLWPVYIDKEYFDWEVGTALEEYALKANKLGKNVFLVNSLLSDSNFASGRAIHFLNGKVISELDININEILICEVFDH